MTHNSFVSGDLSWPMPDFGLVAVWRAMAIDASRWDDWKGFVQHGRTAIIGVGTIGAMVDDVIGRPSAGALDLVITDTGVRLRAYFDQAEDCQRLAIAWRLAADLGASGEFAWSPCERSPQDVAYHAVIGDYESRWEMLRAGQRRSGSHRWAAGSSPPQSS